VQRAEQQPGAEERLSALAELYQSLEQVRSEQ
jgi:hypothetical protein